MLMFSEMLSGKRPIMAGELAKSKRKELVGLLKRSAVTISSTKPIKEATVTHGGVCTDEIDAVTMGSRICEGLFFAGEVIDVDGPCGGYNLQMCFSTGALAGRSAAKSTIQ